jgi:hypothetical protein
VGGGTQSIVGSTGQSLAIETTAFATLAWLRAGNEYVANVEKARANGVRLFMRHIIPAVTLL